MKMNKKGFTLIEMLVVIAIIAVLVAIVVPTVSSATLKSKAATDAANLRTITAQAAVDYLEDSKVKAGYTIDLKTDSSDTAVAITWYIDPNENLVGLVNTNQGIPYFTDVAENGTTTGATTTDTTATGWAPATVG